MLADERRGQILRVLNSVGAVRVADLAANLDVSEMTVRRDLDALDAQDLLRKVHGGAVTRHKRGEEPWSAVKAGQQRAEKAAIAAVAAETVEDGMTIAIGAGTTTTELARSRGAQILFEAPEAVPLLRADPDRLTQVMLNLIS
ncbi:MAG TPA: DeoR family transcriptional regulator, partial [Mycobacterium sp.]